MVTVRMRLVRCAQTRLEVDELHLIVWFPMHLCQLLREGWRTKDSASVSRWRYAWTRPFIAQQKERAVQPELNRWLDKADSSSTELQYDIGASDSQSALVVGLKL